MAIVVDCTTLIIRVATIATRFPGGMARFEVECPTRAQVSDGSICGVAFMAPADARSFIKYLEGHGFRPPTAEGSPEMVIVERDTGPLTPCDWIEVGEKAASTPEGVRFTAPVAWLRGEATETFIAHPMWNPHHQFFRPDPGQFEWVGRQGRVEEYRDRETGRKAWVGRPEMPGANIAGRYERLSEDLDRLEAGDFETDEEARHLAVLCRKKAIQLADDAGPEEAGPYLLWCVAARYLERWGEVESAARRVTELRPEVIDGWLELTAALGRQGRAREAEDCARQAVELDPRSPAALGNHAVAIHNAGRPREAFPVIEAALAVDPDNEKSRIIRDLIRPSLPWWKRLFG